MDVPGRTSLSKKRGQRVRHQCQVFWWWGHRKMHEMGRRKIHDLLLELGE